MRLLWNEEADKDFHRLLAKGEDNLTDEEWADLEDYKRQADYEYFQDFNFYR